MWKRVRTCVRHATPLHAPRVTLRPCTCITLRPCTPPASRYAPARPLHRATPLHAPCITLRPCTPPASRYAPARPLHHATPLHAPCIALRPCTPPASRYAPARPLLPHPQLSDRLVGALWQQTLYHAVDASRCVVALLSDDYLQSAMCTEEFNLALAKHMEKVSACPRCPIPIRKAQIRAQNFRNTYIVRYNIVDIIYSASSASFYVSPKPFDNKPSHSTCCHLAIGSGTNILPIQ